MRWLLWWRPPFFLKPILVCLKGEPQVAIEGVLYATRGRWWTIKHASVHEADTPPRVLPSGEAVVHRDNVLFVQVS